MNDIFHITKRSEWETAVAQGHYRPPSLDEEGFIHCSTAEQVLQPADSFYRGQTGLVLLQIDVERVQAPIVYEDCYESGQKFPHIYGRLSPTAVSRVYDFPPNRDGTFTLPDLIHD